jgi:putative lipase involved disintegration of autophagic bodies
MIYKHGSKYRRKIGQSRKSQSIYDNLGHPHDVAENKEVIFIGKTGEPYSLTKNKVYKTVGYCHSRKFCYDQELADKCKHKKEKYIKQNLEET